MNLTVRVKTLNRYMLARTTIKSMGISVYGIEYGTYKKLLVQISKKT